VTLDDTADEVEEAAARPGGVKTVAAGERA
jgi:hypothetical protein